MKKFIEGAVIYFVMVFNPIVLVRIVRSHMELRGKVGEALDKATQINLMLQQGKQ